jgi:hypothetical protein
MEDPVEGQGRMDASCELLMRSGCFPEGGDCSSDEGIALIEDRMRCNIMNCLASLRVLQSERKNIQKSTDDLKHDMLKRKVFAAACSLMIFLMKPRFLTNGPGSFSISLWCFSFKIR